MPNAPIADALATTASVFNALEHAVTDTGRKGAQQVGSTGHRTYPMPVNLDVSAARVRLQQALRRAAYDVLRPVRERVEWSRSIMPFGPVRWDGPMAQMIWRSIDRGPVSANPRACATWLLAVHQLAPAFLDPVAADLLAEYEAADAVLHPVDNTAPKSEAGRRLETAIVAGQQWLTAGEIETATAATGERIKASTVRVWASRGKLRGHEAGGRVRYNLGDVLACRARRDGLQVAA